MSLATPAPLHPVKAELWRLLGGVTACAALLLLLYLALDWQLDRMRQTLERFHGQALRLNDELSTVIASMTMPPGMSSSALNAVDSEVTFVAAVTRDFSRAQALLKGLIDLHEREGDPAFRPTLNRLRRAADELQTLDRNHQGSPLELARTASAQPLYASIVVQQTRRLHEQAARLLQGHQDDSRRLFSALFAAVCVVLAVGLGLQLRRSLRGIDAILARERDAHEDLSALLTALPDLWFQLDDEGCFLDVSDARHASLDRPWDALKGRPCTLVPAAVRERPDTLPLWTGSREARTVEYEVSADARGPRVYEARWVPTSRGHWLYLSRDISERARVERALAESKEELERQVALRTQQLTIARDVAEQANRSKSEFLSRMSHELRTPMNAVLGFAQLMSMNQATTPAQRQSVDHILRAGKHLLHLINDVLDLAHVESGRLTLSPEALGLQEVALEVVTLMRPQADSHRVQLNLGIGPDVVVRGDRLRIKQVLLNLVSNAIKYNRPGGWVRLGAQKVADRTVISVEDSGQGLSEEGRGKLFEPFVRLAENPEAVEGTGIGLSVCKRLVELMDGRIGVESRIGKGSRFWVDLPSDHRAEAPPPVVAHDEPHGSKTTKSATVLYVEDNPGNLALVSQIIERHPRLTLITAKSVAHGLELARTHRPDLMFIDLHLGDGSGYQLLSYLRAAEETRSIPAVALTANAMPLEETRAREAGFVEFVTKPIDVARFDELLGSMLGRS